MCIEPSGTSADPVTHKVVFNRIYLQHVIHLTVSCSEADVHAVHNKQEIQQLGGQ
jgi:hypothetical protein